ncbi:transporter substrate-binding domain-containing protein [Ramlibacter sp. AW1]|uniref:Transporter substrate-binding domain-containing protein n=1 Tax=Ramlibacter aurantiacus TaxID=2801330 RepID=A0A936ZKR8_9BURK|nr:transporter substrate-binding domain-containing protein [Ramlibacter aurantiacus]MBL0422008.1 transporter substrate-binding domain-containing protein [Ramlibacter aurantiacus]
MRRGHLLHLLLAALVLVAWLPRATAAGDALDEIQRRGRLVVGVKKDVPLWGHLDPRSGLPVGLEPDLAADLARRLGVRLELVGLLTAERIDAVARRQVDVLVATLSDTPDRRQQLRLVLPHYYASGANVMARRDKGFTRWSDLRNRRVCGRRGAFYNRAITVTHGVDVVAVYGNHLALAALRDGRCDAVLYDDINIIALLQEPAWLAEFEMPLPTLHVAPWAIAVHPDEGGGRLEARVSHAVADWHRTGLLLDLQRKWGIPESDFTRRRHEAWTRRLPGGAWYCGDSAGKGTPEDCL